MLADDLYDDAACSCAQYDEQGICSHIPGVSLKWRASGNRAGHGKRPSVDLSVSKSCQFKETGCCKFGSRCKFRAEHEKVLEVAEAKKATNNKENIPIGFSSSSSSSVPTTKNSGPLPLDSFFKQYPTFTRDHSASVSDEFHRMRSFFKWKRGDKDADEATQQFKSAMVQQFNAIYSTDENDLQAWRQLCEVLNIPPPQTLDECKAAVLKMHFNIVDLVDRKDRPVPVFSSLDDLKEYTVSTKKFFPKGDPNAGPLLRCLLRVLSERPRIGPITV